MKIYAGRTEIPKVNKHIPTYEEMAAKAKEEELKPKVQQFVKDKVTFSQEGLRNAKEMRGYLNEKGLNNRIDLKANLEELDKQLHLKSMDYTNNFLSEMQQVMNEERAAWGSECKGNSFDTSLTLMAKAYQVVHDRIVDEFARDDRDTTYIFDEVTKAQREETVEDRLAELNHAYDLHTTFLAASKKAMAQIKEAFGKEKLSEKPEDIEKKTKEACMEAVSEKNLERLRHKVNSFHQYSLNLSIGTHWRQVLGKVW